MKKIFPIVLILCAVGAWASIITKNINTPKQYEEYLLSADKAYKQEYYYEAIQKAVSVADEGDTILLLGKGSDKFFLDKNGRIPWMSDRTAAEKAIEMKKKGMI